MNKVTITHPEPNAATIASQAFARDPLLAAVMTEHGIKVGMIEWKVSRKSKVDIFASDLPESSLHLSTDGHGRVKWPANGKSPLVNYLLSPNTKRVTIDGTNIPETVAAALTGKSLSSIIDLPCAQQYDVVRANHKDAGNGTCLIIMTVEINGDDE